MIKKKMKKLLIGGIAASLVVSMSGCSVTISIGDSDKEEKKVVEESKEEVSEKTGVEVTRSSKNIASEITPTQKPKLSPTPIPTPTTIPTSTPTPLPTPTPQQVQTRKDTTQYLTYYVVNCKQSITLRPQPDVSSGELCQIPLGAAVSYVESARNGFYKIVYNGTTGYALASYLSTSKPTGTTSYVSGELIDNTNNFPTYYVVNCKESITLRTSASTQASEICQIPLGAAVSYISAASNGFYYISYQGNDGYALASYLSSSSGVTYYDTCRVVNCRESITLRPQPDVDSGEICQIPLGATVSYVGIAQNGFYEIYYMGNHGYSLAEYLQFE